MSLSFERFDFTLSTALTGKPDDQHWSHEKIVTFSTCDAKTPGEHEIQNCDYVSMSFDICTPSWRPSFAHSAGCRG